MVTVVLAWIGAAVGVILLLVLLVPFRVRAHGRVSGDALAGVAEVRWLFGALALRWSSEAPGGLLLLGRRVAGWGRGRRERVPQRARKSKRGIGWALQNRGALWRVLVRALAALRIRCELRGRVGLGDPADTAFLVPLAMQLERPPSLSVRLDWDWLDEVIELEGRMAARLWLAQLVAVMLPLLLDGEVRRLVRAPA